MQQQILAPGMKDGDDADFRTEALGLCRHFEQRGGSGGEEQIVKAARVLQRQHVQFVWNAKDNMEVSGRQDFLFTSSEPTLACLCLTLGAMPITA